MGFIHTLGDTVKKARKRLGLTQLKAAEICSIDLHTILNIENYQGNPKMTVLFSLVRGLQIDSQKIFYPGMEIKNPSVSQLRFLIEDRSEQEAAALIPVVQAFPEAVRSNVAAEIKLAAEQKKSLHPYVSRKQALRSTSGFCNRHLHHRRTYR